MAAETNKKMKIYQEFNLDLDSIPKDDVKLIKTGASQTLVQKLLEKGYEVFESNSRFNGAPESIILGSDFNLNCKADFYNLTCKLGLPYRSGPFYIKRE
jgi:hypothetical protein